MCFEGALDVVAGCQSSSVDLQSVLVQLPHTFSPSSTRDPVKFRSYGSRSLKALALQKEVNKMQISAPEIKFDRKLAFYSRVFLVKKTTGGWRAVIELLPLME